MKLGKRDKKPSVRQGADTSLLEREEPLVLTKIKILKKLNYNVQNKGYPLEKKRGVPLWRDGEFHDPTTQLKK